MGRVALEEAYPQIRFLPRSRNLWARLKGVAAECEHLDFDARWMATFIPDTLYLRGKSRAQRETVRPEVSLCRKCLLGLLRDELEKFSGRVVAFEPDAESFSQYFFVAREDFEAAGLLPEISEAIAKRLAGAAEDCEECSARARWLWFPREEVGNLDEAGRIHLSRGKNLCAAHGAKELCRALEAIPEANVYYMNAPYGESGAYLWI